MPPGGLPQPGDVDLRLAGNLLELRERESLRLRQATTSLVRGGALSVRPPRLQLRRVGGR
jgi:hypothetical protein